VPRVRSRRELEEDFAFVVNNIKQTLEQIERHFPRDCNNHLKCLGHDLEVLGDVHDALRKTYSSSR